jgi:hypothetical protein
MVQFPVSIAMAATAKIVVAAPPQKPLNQISVIPIPSFMVQSLHTPQDIAAIFALVTKPVMQGQKAEQDEKDVHQAAPS